MMISIPNVDTRTESDKVFEEVTARYENQGHAEEVAQLHALVDLSFETEEVVASWDPADDNTEWRPSMAKTSQSKGI